jgi:hypothetical protein
MTDVFEWVPDAEVLTEWDPRLLPDFVLALVRSLSSDGPVGRKNAKALRILEIISVVTWCNRQDSGCGATRFKYASI